MPQGLHACWQRGVAQRAGFTALKQALDRIVASDDGATQVIAPADVGFAPTCIDLRHIPDAEGAAQHHAKQETHTPFDLSRGPLIRSRLLQLAEQQQRLLMTMHHGISDSWSIGLLLHERGVLSAGFIQGQPNPLPPLPIQYADYNL